MKLKTVIIFKKSRVATRNIEHKIKYENRRKVRGEEERRREKTEDKKKDESDRRRESRQEETGTIG